MNSKPNKVRVMIIEDSISVREMLTSIIQNDPRLEVVAAVSTAEEGIQALPSKRPDVISLDIRLPGMNGFEATQEIMSHHPTPIVVIAENVKGDELNISMNALRAGALAVVEKPVGVTNQEYTNNAEKICSQLVAMSTIKVVRQRFNGSKARDPDAKLRRTPFKILAVVASTGGPSALVQLFQSLPANFPLPILLVQHITAAFLQSFAEWLGKNCPFSVSVAFSGEVPRPGRIYVAPPDHHLELNGDHLVISRSAMVSAQRPSGTVLLNSVAECYGNSAIGVILTGMGDDGAEGLLAMRNAGAYTIVEDESTAVINGMPAAAAKLGAVVETLPIHEVGFRIVSLLHDVSPSLRGEVRE
jgi:two-component system, chemotaxis family, protein-glutamate methylesterase/glutaminase